MDLTHIMDREINKQLISKKYDVLPRKRDMDVLAFPFLCKKFAVFASKNPQLLFMAKRQKAQEAVHIPFLLRTSYFFTIKSTISLFPCHNCDIIKK